MRSAKYSGPTFVETPFAVVATKSLWGPVSTSFAHLESEVFCLFFFAKQIKLSQTDFQMDLGLDFDWATQTQELVCGLR